jgi:hypothetical protein
MGKKQLVIAIVIAGHDGIVADGLARLALVTWFFLFCSS